MDELIKKHIVVSRAEARRLAIITGDMTDEQFKKFVDKKDKK